MLGRPQRGVVRSSSRPTESLGPDCEPDPREDAVWGARDVVSSVFHQRFLVVNREARR